MVQKTNKIIVSIILLLLFFYPLKNYSQEVDQKSIMLISAMEKAHVSPVGINNKLSNRIHSLFLHSIDESGLYFLEKDILFFNNYRDSLDEQIIQKNNTFFEIVKDTLFLRLQKVNGYIEQIAKSELTFDKSDSIIIGNSPVINYSKSFHELKSRWNTDIKWDVLSYLSEKTNDSIGLSEKETEKILKQGLLLNKEEWDCEYEYMNNKQNFNDYLLDAFLNSIAMSYDPHSAYISQPTKDVFEESLSSDVLSFGVSFYKENKVFKVQSLVPGSEAWQTGLINIDDQLINLQLPDSSYIKFSCLTSEDLESILKKASIKQIVIEIKKKNEELIKLTLLKSKIKNDDNLITSLVVKGKYKVGYISLPSFYQNFEQSTVKGCANDFAKEIFKLKKDNIKGLVIDLRFNGGGSLKEATDLAGIFIDNGILGFIKNQSNTPYLIKDFNRGRAYSGPLIIIVNGASASASEVFAETLQTYNRALIVGSKSFGKSTGQMVLPLDTTLWGSSVTSNIEPMIESYIKVTNGKLYNVNRSSHQVNGVNPDIYIPSIWENYFDSESDYKYALPNDSIDKKVKYNQYPPISKNNLISKSKYRIDNNSIFQFINSFNDSLSSSDQNKTIYLTPELFTKYSSSRSKKFKYIAEKIKVDDSLFTIETPVYYEEIEQLNSLLKKRNTKLKKRLKEDIEFNEAFNIITDYINQINNKK
jgi:carboxyl-terminal processing protease